MIIKFICIYVNCYVIIVSPLGFFISFEINDIAGNFSVYYTEHEITPNDAILIIF